MIPVVRVSVGVRSSINELQFNSMCLLCDLLYSSMSSVLDVDVVVICLDCSERLVIFSIVLFN